MTPADPFSRIPDPSSGYEGTVLETSAERAARPACRVCNDTGIVTSPDLDGESAYESACPERVHDGQPCLICSGRGWTEIDHCTCGTGPSGYYGMHERHCGLEPCPRGCPFVAPGPARPQEEPQEEVPF